MEAELRKAFEAWISASPMEKNLGRRSSDPEASAWPGTYKSYEVQLAWDAWQEAWNRRPSVPPGERERRLAEALEGGLRKLETYAGVFPGDKELRRLVEEWSAILAATAPDPSQAGTCNECGGPVFHRPGFTGEFDHECVTPGKADPKASEPTADRTERVPAAIVEKVIAALLSIKADR